MKLRFLKQQIAIIIFFFSPIVMLAQDVGATGSVKDDSAKVQLPNITNPTSGNKKELFPQTNGSEVLKMKTDSIYSKGLKPDEAGEIAKPEKKKGVKISSKDCPVT